MNDHSKGSFEELEAKFEDVKKEITRLRSIVPQTNKISRQVIKLIEKRHVLYTEILSRKESDNITSTQVTPTKTETQPQNSTTDCVEDLPMHVDDEAAPSIVISADGRVLIDKDYVITLNDLNMVLKETQFLNSKIQSGTASDLEKQKVRYLSLKLYEQMHSDNVALYATSFCNEPGRLEKAKFELSDVRNQINMLVTECPQVEGYVKPKKPAKRKHSVDSSPPQIEKANKFTILEEEVLGNSTTEIKEPNKIPPLIVSNVSMYSEISHVLTNSEIKYSCNAKPDRLVFSVKELSDYKRAKDIFLERNYPFHTYGTEPVKRLKVVLKNVPADVEPEEIKEALIEKGYKINSVYQLKKTVERTKIPLPVFYIDLPYGEKSEEIYDLSDLLHLKVNIEPYKKRRGPTQCYRCQRYNHTKNNCFHPPRCVKCAGDHLTSACAITYSETPKCAQCGEGHVASYSGCKMFPKPKSSLTPCEIVQESNQLQDQHPVPEANTNNLDNEDEDSYKFIFKEFITWFRDIKIRHIFKSIKDVFQQLKNAKSTMERFEIILKTVDSIANYF